MSPAQRQTFAVFIGLAAHLLRRISCIACAAGIVTGAAAAADSASEAAVKAAFVYNFAKFVQWHDATAAAPNNVRICTAGIDTQLAGSIAALEGKPVQSRLISVKRDAKSAELDTCSVLLLGPGARTLADEARGRAGLLTISDIRGFAASGGIIELFIEDGKMRFEINTRAAQRADLTISSQLLKLAKVTPEQ